MAQFQKSRSKGLHKPDQGRYHFGKKTKKKRKQA